ncbi:MAG: serine/threonine-protein kinase [bacterium]|nr:serine/threonine-protein kinase [bacterium]
MGELGSGSTGCVFLARHLGLNGLRAIKRVPKSSEEYGSILKEALLLKDLRHSGIPIVYDIEEDSRYGYLIEEYVIGESIFALVNRLGHLEEMKEISYGIQLCQIISYLHSYKICPILYLDLQPKNIFICNDNVKLIDFNRAMLFSEANHHASLRYGTVGFAAPEQYGRERLDERTDIYAIGRILYYLSSGKYQGEEELERVEGMSTPFWEIITLCLKEEREERFASAALLESRLSELIRGSAVCRTPSLTIGFVGSKAGAGTTHLVMSLLSYLYQRNISCLFDEQNSSGMVVKLARYQKIPVCRTSEIPIFGLPFLPFFGENVERSAGVYDVVLQDFGSDRKRAENASVQALVLVTGGKRWEWAECMEAAETLRKKQKFCIVWNHLDMTHKHMLPEELRKEVQFAMPYYAELFRPDERRDSFLKELWAYLAGEEGGWKTRSFSGNRLKSIFRKQVERGGLWEFLRK